MIQIQIKEMCKASNHWCILSNRWVYKEWTQVVKSTGHKFLNTQYKNHSRYIILSKANYNHQRDQHGYMDIKGIKRKKKSYGGPVW